ncbi:MAG: hypothetical protein M3R03_07510 [Pseudomonadota bacterium]|nr:hypothetical protein [Pseudomonadota bacterium]
MLKTITGATLGLALCFSSTVASAAAVPAAPMSISPFVALSAYGTMQSRSAVCATAVGAAGAAAAVEGQPAAGCVLPVLDPVAPVVVETAPPAVFVPAAAPGFGFGIGALLAGLVALAGIAAVVLSNNDDDGRLPISPA